MSSILKVSSIQDPTNSNTALSIDSSGRVDMNASYVFDQWYLNANHTTDGDATLTAWSQVAQIGTGKVSGMSHSAGFFTFPQTGLYKVGMQFFTRSDASDSMSCNFLVTTDNTTYYNILNVISGDSDTVNGGAFGQVFINVTDVSNVKIRFKATSMDPTSYVYGNSSLIQTAVMFERVAPAQ